MCLSIKHVTMLLVLLALMTHSPPPLGSISKDLKLDKPVLLLSYLCQYFYFKNITTKLQINLTGSDTAICDEIPELTEIKLY